MPTATKTKNRAGAGRKARNGKSSAKQTVVINFILDRTGSMESVRDETIRGYNVYKDGLSKDKGTNYLWTLTIFDSASIDVIHEVMPIRDVPDLTHKTYVPRAATPLHDAVGRTVRRVEKEVKKDQKVITVIMTDGYENASHEWTLDAVRKLIKEKEAAGWTFVYLAANPEAWGGGMAMGIAPGSAVHYFGAATGQTMAVMATNTTSYTQSLARGVADNKNFFNVDLKKKIELLRKDAERKR